MAFHAEIGTLRKSVSESCSGVQDGLGGSVAETLTRWTSDRTALRKSVSESFVSCESFESCSGVQDPLGGSVVGTLWWRIDWTGTAFFALWLVVLLERWDALDFEVPMVECLLVVLSARPLMGMCDECGTGCEAADVFCVVCTVAGCYAVCSCS